MNDLFILSSVAKGAAPYVILVAYMLTLGFIAYYSRKKSNTLDNFFMANRGMGGWMSAFSYGATYFSSVVFIGYAGKLGWGMGLGAVWIGIANAVFGSFLAWRVLGAKTRYVTRKIEAKTMPQFFEKRYQDTRLRLVSSIIIFVFLIPYSTSVYQGIGYLFEMVFGIDFIYCIIIMAVITSLYLFSGGYFATALSDFFQGMIMFVVVFFMVFALLRAPQVNGGEGFKKLVEMGQGFFPSLNSASGRFIDSPGFNLIIIVILTSFGVWALPQCVHKYYAVKNKYAIKQATVVSTVFAFVIGIGAYLSGSFGRLFFASVPAGGVDMIMPNMFIQANFSGTLLGFVVVLMLSASMSTLASLSLSGSSAMALDFYKGYLKKDAPEKKVKLLLRVLCIVFVILSAVLAVAQLDVIVTMMSLSWGTLAGCFIGPYIFGIYSKKASLKGAWLSIIGGLVTTFTLIIVFALLDAPKGATAMQFIKAGIGRSPLIGVITMAQSLIIMAVSCKFFPDKDKEHAEYCFSYEKE
jgi:SSS family solute:Na+ symporter